MSETTINNGGTITSASTPISSAVSPNAISSGSETSATIVTSGGSTIASAGTVTSVPTLVTSAVPIVTTDERVAAIANGGTVDNRFNALEQQISQMQSEISALQSSHGTLQNAVANFEPVAGQVSKLESMIGENSGKIEIVGTVHGKQVGALTAQEIHDFRKSHGFI